MQNEYKYICFHQPGESGVGETDCMVKCIKN